MPGHRTTTHQTTTDQTTTHHTETHHTGTYDATVTVPAEGAAADRDTWVTTGRAARELGLKRTEFDLAVQLGRIRAAPDGGGGRRVERAEIERLRAGPGFPESLRRSVRALGTTEGAALMEVTKTRFTRLARLGLLVPVTFYPNRYRAVVWLYLAEELRLFAADDRNAPLLTGRTPEGLRSQLDAGVDLRPRNWRARHLGFLLRQAEDPWARAGAVASLLDPLHVSQVVQDPYDRSHLNRFRRPAPSHGAPGSPAAHIAEELTTARDADEIAWLQADLTRLTDEARHHRPAPRPAPRRPAPAHRTPRAAEPARRTSRGLLGRWRRRDR
ncbi:DUF6397 family protein [Streptomyces capillispiralis]|uniref:Uncharacterized protein n=1 Tax=Streptomyces capillispiralis TaxID=68182 RepID=A0A561TPN2_9ACTN|nr:DUF6397 family protein [Streptomyces capillispiralis]TWF89060.1 hypothetical protein FHX78_116102 [Streptomyces capillispiralis]GHH93330.1 hypothetical protein GCM10017779_37870 [Streptomyces capillispiralis]